MAACVLPICSARQRETSVILFFFFLLSREPSFYTVTHFPIRAFANSTNGWTTFLSTSYPTSSSLVQVVRGDIPRNLRRFCCTGLSPRGTFCFRAVSRCCFAFVSHSENCMREARGSLRRTEQEATKKWIQYLLKVRTIERAERCWYWYHWLTYTGYAKPTTRKHSTDW